VNRVRPEREVGPGPRAQGLDDLWVGVVPEGTDNAALVFVDAQTRDGREGVEESKRGKKGGNGIRREGQVVGKGVSADVGLGRG
jgi:hypothetical protein